MGTLWKFTLRQVQRRPGRALLTLLGITIGVATIVAISATTSAANHAYKHMFDSIGGKAALEITEQGGGGFDPALVQKIQEISEVRELMPVVHTHAGAQGKKGTQLVLTLGVSLKVSEDLRSYHVATGRDLKGADEVLLGADFASDNGIVLNQKLRLVTSKGLPEVQVVGLIDSSGVGVFDGGAVAILPLTTAQRIFALENQVNSVQVVLQEGADLEAAKAAITQALPSGFRAQEPYARGMLAREGTLSTEMALSSLSVVSLVGGAFVILNSFLMSLGERRRQLAILRALGTTRRQVLRLLLREAVFLGLLGTVLGLGLGAVLAKGLIAVQEQLLYVKLPPLSLSLQSILMGVIVGPGMAVAATIVPAWRAGSRPPLEAMLPNRSGPAEKSRYWPAYAGIGCLILASTSVLGLTMKWWSGRSAKVLLGPTMALMLFGCVLALPLILRPIQRLTARMFKPWAGMEGAIAFRQMERQHTRTGLTVGVLFIGVIVTVGFGSTLLDSVNDINTWFNKTIQSDFLVRGIMPKPSTLSAVELKEDLGKEIAEIPGVSHVGNINFVLPVFLHGKPSLLLARTFPQGRPLGLAVVHGSEEGIRKGLAGGEVVLGTTLANRCGLNVGDPVELQAKDGKVTLRICGIVKEYTVGGMAFYLEWNRARDLLDFQGVHTFEVSVVPGQVEKVRTALKRFVDKKGLLLQTNDQLRAMVQNNIDAVVGFLWCLIALMFVVASLGIINTLTMNILEQTREIGVLRAIGLKRGQLQRMILLQAVGMAVISILPGVVVGLLLAWLMNITTPALSGHNITFRLHPLFMAACAGIAIVVSFLAAILPARRAAKINVIEALQYE